jgi:putative GTP pyrophosphokinase
MVDDLGTKYEMRVPLLRLLAKALEEETNAALNALSHIDRISFRVKGTRSFVEKALDRKADPPYDNPLVEVEDQVAGRVIVFFLSDVPLVLNRLKGTFNTVELRHARPPKDQEFGYESHHLICVAPPHLTPNGWGETTDLPTTFELQIRTTFMHAYAEPQHDVGYKTSADLPRDIRRELGWIAASAWGADQALERIHKWDAARADTAHSGDAPSGPTSSSQE